MVWVVAKRIAFEEASEAGQLWKSIYGKLSTRQPGLLGAITGRAAPKVLRLAMFYAAVDLSEKIEVVHLKAALALHQYCVDSAMYIWGDLTGDQTADALLEALRRCGATGMSRTQIRDAFNRNKPALEIDNALELLKRYKKATRGERPSGPSGGKPTQVWIAL
jgi:hypothetical protein